MSFPSVRKVVERDEDDGNAGNWEDAGMQLKIFSTPMVAFDASTSAPSSRGMKYAKEGGREDEGGWGVVRRHPGEQLFDWFGSGA